MILKFLKKLLNKPPKSLKPIYIFVTEKAILDYIHSSTESFTYKKHRKVVKQKIISIVVTAFVLKNLIKISKSSYKIGDRIWEISIFKTEEKINLTVQSCKQIQNLTSKK